MTNDPISDIDQVPAPELTELAPAITRVSTFRHESWPNLAWVEIEDDDGNVGLGETFSLAEAVTAYVHEGAAPYLLGKSPADRARHWQSLYRQRGRSGIGAEARGASAVDIALWDLTARRAGLPLYELLGGRSRPRVRAYNTCVGPDYVKALLSAGGLDTGRSTGGRFDDLWAFQNEPEKLAESLLEMGITAMKIWPFDPIAGETEGLRISPAQLREGLAPLRRITKEFGEQMDVALELHSGWHLGPAQTIARAAEEYQPLWIEDPMRIEDLGTFDRLCRSTTIPILTGEQIGARWGYKDLLQHTEVSIVMCDPVWTGGISEARRVADLAAAFQRSFTPHDCTGPVGLAVGTHLALYGETAIFQEMVRAFLYGWYAEAVDGLPELKDGFLTPAERAGHGVTLRRSPKDDNWIETTSRA